MQNTQQTQLTNEICCTFPLFRSVFLVRVLSTPFLHQVVDTFGQPMKAYGEMTRRGRRRYVRYVVTGVENEGA